MVGVCDLDENEDQTLALFCEQKHLERRWGAQLLTLSFLNLFIPMRNFTMHEIRNYLLDFSCLVSLQEFQLIDI